MKPIVFFIALLITQILRAEKQEIFLQQLTQVNTEWTKQSDIKPILQTADFYASQSFTDWIGLHLRLVETTLRLRDVSKLSSTQQDKRNALLDELKKYSEAGSFPINDYLTYKNPVFIDRNGTHCAVGYLMQQSGDDVLAQKINAAEKFAFVHEIKTQGVKEWADENGFSVEELAWIQPTYMPQTVFTPLEAGTNGPVKVLFPDYYYGGVIVVGAFDTLNDFPCANIGIYKNNQLNCLGDGLEGVVNDIARTSRPDSLVVGGSLLEGGKYYPLAQRNGNNWVFDSIPNREGATATSIFSGGLSYLIEAAITHPSILGSQEIWYKMYNGGWKKKATVNGVISDIEASQWGRVYVGAFDSATISRTGLSDTIIPVNNVIFHENYADHWFGIIGQISDTVLVAKAIGNALYFGGTCSYAVGRSGVCLSRYLNGTLQTMMPVITGNSSMAIHAIELYDSYNLIIGGDFQMLLNFGVSAKNLVLYDLAQNYLTGYGYLDESVNTLATTWYDDNWYLAGDFTANLNTSLPHLARIGGITGINELNNSHIQIYPNPTSDNFILLTPETKSFQLEIINSIGEKIVEQQIQKNSEAISCKDFPKGLYVVRVNDGEQSIVQRLIVQ